VVDVVIVNEEALKERARNLGALNGMSFVLVDLQPPGSPTEAKLELHFINANELATIVGEVAANPGAARQIFAVSGGHRMRAGPITGQIQVTGVAAGPTADTLVLTVGPIGDYSTYTLSLEHANIDPIFSELPFKFRPGCFNTDCAPDWEPPPPPGEDPRIDYMAKDFDSFRHTMIAAMGERVPDWRPTTEADLDQTLLELFSAAADELSDYQDRVMNEAYLGTARNRVSLARHGRLMDYHIHQGNQASTWLALELSPAKDGTLPPGLTAWTAGPDQEGRPQVFLTREPFRVHSLLSRIGLYTWNDTRPALAAGTVSADLRLAANTQLMANTVRDLIRSGLVTHLLIQEWLNPATGLSAGRDVRKRQLLKLVSGPSGAETIQDPLTGRWIVRARWREADGLRENYCFTVDCPSGKVEDVSLFHGNLVHAFHGQLHQADFLGPGQPFTGPAQFRYERTDDGTGRWGTICRLPVDDATANLPPLAYRTTEPGGDEPTRSTVAVTIEYPDGSLDPWDERISLVHSDGSPEGGDHFIVETDEEGRSVVRFGNGTNGQELPDGAVVHCRYQVGDPQAGNVGADTILHLDHAFDQLVDQATVWNPFDVTDGRDPERPSQIIRRVPEAFRARQLRAITLPDYVRRTEELPRVSRAAARYSWTGSWRTVQVTIDPAGTETLAEDLRRQVAAYLDPVRLIGEDLEIRAPRFVPLAISVSVCIGEAHWPEDVRFILEQEFSDGFTREGRLGFFNPDGWSFGQELHSSQIVGRAQAVEGVDHVVSVAMRRWDETTAGTDAIVAVRPNEIIQVHNDPDHMELGSISFDLQGGRR
jgi:hypothetical protein